MKYLTFLILPIISIFAIHSATAKVLETQNRDMPFEECKAFINGNGNGLPASHYKTVLNKPDILKKRIILADADVVMTCTKADNKLTLSRESK